MKDGSKTLGAYGGGPGDELRLVRAGQLDRSSCGDGEYSSPAGGREGGYRVFVCLFVCLCVLQAKGRVRMPKKRLLTRKGTIGAEGR